MWDAFRPGESILWDYSWQSTVLLPLGLGGSAALARRPARAHRLLLLAVVAAMVTPLLAQAARRGGWGLLTRSAMSPATGAPAPTIDAPTRSPLVPRGPVPFVPVAGPRAVDPPRTVSPPAPPAGDPHRFDPFTGYSLAMGAWLILTALAAVRLVTSFCLGLCVVRHARPLEDERLDAAASDAAARMGMNRTPELRLSTRTRCPSIWCWGRRPVILMPTSGGRKLHWIGVFCHELAHWVRRDHLSGLLAEVMTCLLPWHPLAWLARHRLGQLSELACDNCVLSTGLPATDYAETLLGLVPHRHAPMALAAISSRHGLTARVRLILEERPKSPIVGTRWACTSAAAMVLAASALALAQTRPAGPKVQENRPQPDAAAPPMSPSERADSKRTDARRTIHGNVLGPDGQPVAGATVLWIVHRRPTLPNVAMPKDHQARRSTRSEVLGETTTDAKGAFALAADFHPGRYFHQEGLEGNLLVKAPGLGMAAPFLKAGTTDLTLRLAPEVVIRGRLLAPSGLPAAGVRVALRDFIDAEMTDGMGVDTTLADAEIPAYWPRPRMTDAEGRFTLDGMPLGVYAELEFRHPDYAADEVTVSTGVRGGIKAVMNAWVKAFEIAPVQPTFTHVLEPARPVQGRVTDKATGKPLAGILVQMTAMRRRGGTPQYTRTDADGRYRISGPSAESYRTTVYPPADSAYLALRFHQQGWPAG
ncbi:MAG TPA: carboxypeptidase regulatory-like domain-containing protein, partial [Isosphaeraceae bacterium]|nr:carboxypeptidase regulatory-like domain-containing protein [Isosphaeraceae bacterium]